MSALSQTHNMEGKVAIVTGGSRGLGREMAIGFAEAGAAGIVVVSRKRDACEQVAAEIERLGVPALAVPCHMGHWGAIDELVKTIYSTYDRVDVLVNNAGMAPLYPSLSEVSEDLFDKVIGVNLKGPFRLTALVGERMVEHGGGSIINISSVAAVRPQPTDLPYAAAKAGLHALTVGFARAYGPSVRVNAIMAGPFLTDISKAWDLDAVAEEVRSHALQRAGKPREIVGTALYYATEASSFTSGSVIAVDGGMSTV